jgi:hypothetical protein
VWAIFISLTSFIIYKLQINHLRTDLKKTVERVKEDVKYEGGQWQLNAYNADKELSDVYPLYIISSEGLVIDRSRPISGLLDFSRFTLLNQYATPSAVERETGEKWEVLSSVIKNGEQPVGIIFASFYDPATEEKTKIDELLTQAINEIHQMITVEGDQIDTSKVDSRKLPYQISLQVVNRFNKVLYQSSNVNSVTRMPVTIDRSYIENQLKGDSFKVVTDTLTHAKYLTFTDQILNENKLTAGIVVAGIPIQSLQQILLDFLIAALIASIGLATVLVPVIYWIRKQSKLKSTPKNLEKTLPEIIIFNKKESKIIIDTTEIEIPYSSHQYYFCQLLFQKPQKKWESDEILEVFGEDIHPEKWRKVYDTMVALNKKTTNYVDKLFIIKDKRYFINPKLINLLKQSN